MRSNCWRGTAIGVIAGFLAACASVKPPPPTSMAPIGGLDSIAPPVIASPVIPSPGIAPPPVNAFAALPGWDLDDHAAALAAFRVGCLIVRNPDLARVCGQAIALGSVDEAQSRAFLEHSFRPEAIPETGLLTAYFAPEYEARTGPEGEFTAPVRPRPPDLPTGGQPYYADRGTIELWPARDALAWMRPEDLFFLQIQGSGTLDFPDGARELATSNGTNGARFVGIAQPMRQAGLLADDNTSGETIRAWLAAHRGPRAATLMDLNPRYVFFRLQRDDGEDPKGAAGAPLIPGRSVAVDLDRHSLGEMVWIDAEAPMLVDAFPRYRRLAVALDTGGAIKGDARADLYLGRGPGAGLEAGRVRHQLRLYRLTPIER